MALIRKHSPAIHHADEFQTIKIPVTLNEGDNRILINTPVKRFVYLSNNYGVYPKAFFPEQLTW